MSEQSLDRYGRRKTARQALLDECMVTFGGDGEADAIGRMLDQLGIYVVWKPMSKRDLATHTAGSREESESS